ncbi:hypothetical protein SARC_10697 [Sphaeroforma arctica JP610]|uniref:Glucosamine inositolphosphorylceramide transferase 1 N-terminal domain-containing protein n=1 Tax=Sphaeroforma arctica JP610 TaxID=667725 RepID=A0A0L0FLC0_9EUKA|nr:hypothetical protein SARC_10697 [Sphaeroforma arctica JP610]KNC76823.1 hypothetical protein SARC_10697 [Sphaeroforma arctica JP610]|eukprot:XP_014150725.1 hypothetical protein SARC_10697 [Sphaeroforma arctica JP610]
MFDNISVLTPKGHSRSNSGSRGHSRNNSGNCNFSASPRKTMAYNRQTSSVGSVNSLELPVSEDTLLKPRSRSISEADIEQYRCANRVRVFFFVILAIVSIAPLALHSLRVINNSRTSCGWNNDGAWVTGVAYGPNPYDLSYGTNAGVTCANVKDVPAGFVTDTFIVPSADESEKWLMFFEVRNYDSGHGDIGMAWSPDQGAHWVYESIVVNETYHTSYPFVLRHSVDPKVTNSLVMIPETSAINEVRAYVSSTDTPTEWTYFETLISGRAYSDASVLEYNGVWYMWAYVASENDVHLFYSDSLLEGTWTEHPMSPLGAAQVHSDFRRPAGRPLVLRGDKHAHKQDKVIRYVKEGAQRLVGYGAAVWALEVTELNTTHYGERIQRRISPVGGNGWVSKRVGNVDAHEISPGLWVAGISGDHTGDYPVTRYFISTVVLLLGAGVLLALTYTVADITKRVGATRRHLHRFAMEKVYTHPTILSILTICLGMAVLWQFDFLLDCRPPVNVVNFTGIGPHCDLPEYGDVASCEGYRKLVEKQSIVAAIAGLDADVIVADSTVVDSTANDVAHKAEAVVQNNEHAQEGGEGDALLECEVTLVTALFDLGRYSHKAENMEEKFKARSFEKYQAWFVDILKLNSCLVIYIEEESEALVWEHRNKNNTVVHVIQNITEGYENLSAIKKVLNDESYTSQVVRPGRPEMKFAAYGVTMFKKIDFVKESVVANPFRSEYFFWLDGGYGHGRRMPDFGTEVWPDPKKVREYVSPYQVFILQADQPDSHNCADLRATFMNHKTAMAGGFFGGKAQPLLDFHTSFHRQLDKTLEMGIMDDDQAVFFASWCEQHSLFQMEQCPPNVMCQITGTKRCFDRWNCAVSFFSEGDVHAHHIPLINWIEM